MIASASVRSATSVARNPGRSVSGASTRIAMSKTSEMKSVPSTSPRVEAEPPQIGSLSSG